MDRLEERDIPSVGGGFTDGGLNATYYQDGNFQSPAFTRRDPRIDFDWGTTLKPGGSISPGFRDVGTDNYSVRWQGQLISRFTETYTFSGRADDAVTVEIRPAGVAAWTTVVSQPTFTGAEFGGSYSLVAGQPYDVRVSYREFGGAAAVRLMWASPSTPREVIDPLIETGMNNPDSTAAFADIVRGARNSWGWGAGMDADGWPTGTTEYFFQESLNQGLGLDPLMQGTLRFSFRGKADLNLHGNVIGTSLTYAYDVATNTTSGSFVTADNGSNASAIRFLNPTRDGQVGGLGGVTDFKLMRPTAPGAATTYSSDQVFTREIKDYARHYTVVRHQYVANNQKDWADRTPPTYFNQAGGTLSAPVYPHPWVSTTENGWSWEHKVLFANETGTDLMISLPVLATDAYLTKLANLLRHGSDGVDPYTTPTANPVYPPLNPNLRVHLELGNELWNWAGVFYTDFNNLNQLVAQAARTSSPDFRAINYDNLPTETDASGNYDSMNTWRYRMAVLRTAQAGDIFRQAFGEPVGSAPVAADARVRPVYEWQYANTNDTARLGLTWADRYFNKADPLSTYQGPPRPVNSLLWGGGGATYYGANNSNGLTQLLPDSGFEVVTIPTGYTEVPDASRWSYVGTAGVARDGGPSDDIPADFDGSQVGYLAGTGRMTATFTVPATQTSDQYAVAFKALNRRKVNATAADRQNLRVYLDYGTPQQVDLTARTFSQGDGYTPPGVGDISGWNAQNVFWTESQYYYTKAARLTPGSTHTVTIVGTGAADQLAFLDDVRVTSVDAVFAGGIPGGGEATGQPAGQNVQASMNTAVSWAAAYGLKHLAYEGGWSLGGDDGGSYVQLLAKYGDRRTVEAQGTFMDYYAQAGGTVNVLGTYAQIPSWADYYAEQGLLDAARYPIIGGIDDRDSRLSADPTNGVRLPAVLDRTTVTLADAANAGTGNIGQAAGWLSWNVIAPGTGWYDLSATTTAVGTAIVLADDRPVVAGATGGVLTGSVYLTRGLHTIKVRSVAGGFAVTAVAVTSRGAPAVPPISTLTELNGSVQLTWAAVPGATGYIVQYGTRPGSYTTLVDVGATVTWSVSGLANDSPYYFAVSSYTTGGAESLPSPPRGITALVEGNVGRLSRWRFDGLASGGAPVPATAPASGSAGGMTVGPLTRGPGLVPANDWATNYFPDRFNSFANNNNWPQSLNEAVSRGAYYQFSISPAPGRLMALNDVWFQFWSQTTGPAFGIAAQASVGGGAFTDLSLSGTVNSADGLTASLAGTAGSRDTSATITVRIYAYGLGVYQSSGIGLNTGGDALVVRGIVKSVPKVQSIVVNDGSAQRSMVTLQTVSFNTLVNLAVNAFTVQTASGGMVQASWTTADLGGRTVATISFPTGSVSDGRYRLTLTAEAVTHRAGRLYMAADEATGFYRLFGDLTGDGGVDTLDLSLFRRSYGLRSGDPSFNVAADSNSDGAVDALDLAQFRRRFGMRLP